MEFQLSDFILIIFFIWLSLLSFFLFRASTKWNHIIKDGKKINLLQVLENIIEKNNETAKRTNRLENEIAKAQMSSSSYFQKFSLTRFNPFESTGGDQSFIITLLNGLNDGFIISSLHSRSGTRVYAKQVSAGKPTIHQFSKEEKEIVDKTARLKPETVKAINKLD